MAPSKLEAKVVTVTPKADPKPLQKFCKSSRDAMAP